MEMAIKDRTTSKQSSRPVWRLIPRKLPILLKWLECFISLPLVEVMRFPPSNRESPEDVIRRYERQGFHYCDESTLAEIIRKVRSRTPGYLVVPLDSGQRQILRVETDHTIKKVPRLAFRFLNEPGRWTILMVRPNREK